MTLMAPLSMRFLGVADITLDGVPVQLERRNSLALLAYLVLTNRTHSRDELATLMAGDIADDPARKRLRNALADLVEHGLGDYLLASRQTVAFNVALPHTLDIRQLNDLRAADTSPEPGELAWAADRCDWELLTGLALRDAPAFEIWLLSERERRGQQLRELAQQHLQWLLASDHFEAGVSVAHRLLTMEPWNEAVHRLLMHLLARGGQLAAALAQYDRCRDALQGELGVAPQPETTALFERLRTGAVVPRNNLPTVDPAEMVGRDEQLDAITRDLAEPACRLLTIVGLSGSGKTSMALAAAARLASPVQLGDEHPFADGIVLVNLAEIPEVDPGAGSDDTVERRLATAIGFALGLVFYGHIDRLNQVIAYLQPKRLLLVLDNMEHLQQGAPGLLAILRSAPGVTMLVTSRHPLGVADEWTRELSGLPAPATVDDLEQAPASRLFLREAQRANVRLTPDDQTAIVQICQLTGGWPLALKIAAGWLGPLTCGEIVEELQQGGALLDEPVHGTGSRQASIRSIVVASYDVLPPREQQALSRLAVFSGPFNRQAAEAVGVTSPSLVGLSQRSLLERSNRDSYILHPLVSQYAAEQLANEASEEAAARGDHATYFATLVKDSSPSLFTNPEAHSVIGSEQANVQAAWDWAVGQQNVELLTKLWKGLADWNQQAGLHREWTASLTAAISRLQSDLDDRERDAMLTQLLVAKAESLLWQGDLAGAFPLLEEARHHADKTGILQLEALISFCEGRLLRFRGGENDAATEMLQQARVLARVTQQQRIEADSLLQLANAATDSENYREAESFLHRADEIFQTLGDRLSLARTTNHRGRLSVYRGDYTRAQLVLEQSLHIARSFGDRFLEGYNLMHLGIINDVGYGRHVDATEHFNLALPIAVQTGDPYFDGNIHRAIGRNALHAGDFVRAEQAFNHAVDRARDVGNTRALGESLRCLAQLANASGDYVVAEDRAEQALHLSTEQGRRSASASALLTLGQARERLGRLSNAATSFTEAFNLADALGIPYLRCDATTGLASISLAAGDVGLAVRYVEETLTHLQTQSLAGCEEPGWVIETSIRVLTAAGDRRATETLRLGAELLDRRVSALPQPLRDRYLNTFPERRDVLRRWLDHVASTSTGYGSHLRLGPSVDLMTTPDSTAGQPRNGSPRARHWPSRARRQHRGRPPGGASPA
jgi:DNA-binding SARP family transcriptional activator/predicted ATPase/tetratricopeptide (TPR) repeat protein